MISQTFVNFFVSVCHHSITINLKILKIQFNITQDATSKISTT